MTDADDKFKTDFRAVAGTVIGATILIALALRAIGTLFGPGPQDPAEVADRIAPVGEVRVAKSEENAGSTAAPAASPAKTAGATSGESTAAASGEKVFNTVCMACHATGAAGAPKVGDTAAWKPRAAQGMDTLVAAAMKGKGAMPPKGGNPSLGEDQIRAAIGYMLEKSGLDKD